MIDHNQTKCCCTCKRSLPYSSFNKQKAAKDGLQYRCRVCAQGGEDEYRETRRQYRRNQLKEKYDSPEGYRKHLNRYFKSTYKISLSEYEELSLKQNNKCAICFSLPEDGKRIYIDHCHNSDKVRGLLCFHCNTDLGHFKDNVDVLRSAIKYLCNK